MALRYAVANGNWSNTATWDGGTLPAAGDDVYADGKTVTIDTNVTVANLYTTLRVGGTIGGTFNISSGSYTITANIICGGAFLTNALIISSNSNQTIIGNITGGSNSGAGITFTGTGTLTITGNVTGGGANFAYGIGQSAGIINLTGNVIGGSSFTGIGNSNNVKLTITGIISGNGVNIGSINSQALTLNGTCVAGAATAITNSSTGTVTINGNITAVGNAGVFAILNSSTGIITINGDCLGALSASPSNAYIVNNNTTGIVNINGNVTARSVGPSATVAIVNNNNVGGTINISGNVSGGSVLNAIGVYNNSTGTVNVGGNITGGSIASNSPAIYSLSAGTIDVTGTTTAGLYPALFSTSLTATNILRGNITNVAGVPAYFAYKITVSPTAVQTATMQTTTNVDRLFSTSNVSVGAPAVTNVRLGIVYGSTNELTGTMIVPTPANVRSGVPTDATVGTAALTIADFWDINASTLTTAGSIGDRVRNCSTVDVTGNQIAAFNS